MALRAPSENVRLENAPSIHALPSLPRRSFYRTAGKRAFDLFLGLTLLLLVAPVILILAVLVVATSGFPPFYSAKRVGMDGRSFRMWKLRSMVRNADAMIEYWRETEAEEGLVFFQSYKLKRDPRVTPLGKVLRKTSLDELPQLWNVVRGDMSLVGPRPIVAEELKNYGSDQQAFLSVRPGVTGLWQVSGRNAIDYPERVDVELGYVWSVSLLRDARLLLQTVPTLLTRNGQ